jgi:hypothetical protein
LSEELKKLNVEYLKLTPVDLPNAAYRLRLIKMVLPSSWQEL